MKEEIEIIRTVIEHPAGFIVDMFGGLITIRPHSDGYEVSWDEGKEWVDFSSSHEAAEFFVKKRHELQIGIDIEIQLMKEELHE